MAYQIIGETIKSAISLKLGEIFNNPYRYKENITKPKYPNFIIIQVDANATPKGLSGTSNTLNTKRNRIQLDYSFNIQYRVAEDTELVHDLRQQLDDIGFKLLTNFTSINLEVPIKIKNARYEIVDGVLQFFFDITIFALPEIIDETVMGSLDSEIDFN